MSIKRIKELVDDRFLHFTVGDGSHAGSWRRLLFSVTPLIYRRLYYLITIDYPMYIIFTLCKLFQEGMFAEHLI